MSKIREMFCSRFGDEGLLVEFDFSQLEICALAEVSQDKLLIEELNRGVDIHRSNAAMWLGKKPEDVTTDERKKAKVMTFQLQYGAKPPKMASSLGISVGEAAAFVHAYYNKYSGIKSFHDSLETMKKAAEVSMRKQTEPEKEIMFLNPTPTGRQYGIPARKSDSGTYYYSMTETKNYPIQGFGTADIVPVVLNLIFCNLYEQNFRTQIIPINTVHDSFMFDCRAEYLDSLFVAVETAFKAFPARFKELFDYDLKVAYNYDVKYGKNWASKQMDSLTRKEVQMLIEDLYTNTRTV